MNKYLYRWLFSILFVALVACSGSSPEDAPATHVVQSVASGELNIYNWETYIDPAILTDFEEKFGVTINYTIFESPEEMLAQVRADPTLYDLIVPPDYMVPVMRQESLLTPLSKGNIPNFSNIAPAFLNPAYDPGNRYCVPYQWGTMGIGYNTVATGREIDGWADFFDPDFAGRIALLDDIRSTMGVILLYLGYSPNTTNLAEITAARDFLINHADNIGAYAPDTGQDMLADGEVDLAFEWSGDIYQVAEDNPDIDYVIPVEGALIWTDNICITAGSPNQEMAEAFINYLLEPEVGAALSNFIRYGSPNQASLPLINEIDRNDPGLYPPEEVRARLFFLVDVGPAANQLYEQAWGEIQEHYNR